MSVVRAVEDVVVAHKLMDLDSGYVSTKADTTQPSSFQKALTPSRTNNREVTGISMYDSRLGDKSKF